MFKKLLILFCTVQVLYGQNNFEAARVILKNGDTLNGYAVYKHAQGQNIPLFSFRTAPKGEEVIYTAKQIDRVLFVNGKAILAIVLPAIDSSEQILAEVLIEGKMDLFRYNDRFFITKPGRKTIELREKKNPIPEHPKMQRIQKEYIGVLSLLILKECPSLKYKVEHTQLSEAGLVDIIADYHYCLAESFIIYKASLSWFKFSPSIVIRGGTSFMRLFRQADIKGQGEYLQPRVEISPHFALNISLPRISSSLSICLEAWYVAHSFRGENHIVSSSIERIENNFQFSELRFPFGIRQTFTAEKTDWFVNTGMALRYPIQQKGYTNYEIEQNGLVFTIENKYPRIEGGVAPAFWLGVGHQLRKPAFKIPISAELRAQLDPEILKSGPTGLSRGFSTFAMIGVQF
jgi:hypothetical protein